jgi:acyl-coenzyme A thioesterase PaaI-like protein
MEMPRLSLLKVDENPMCFGCGKDNPHSLKIKMDRHNPVARAEFTPTEYHQGWPGYAHGGALSAAIDECVGLATFLQKIYAVTAKLEIRFKSMARIGEPLVITAQITKQTSRTVEIEVQMKRNDGSMVAEGSSLQFIVHAQDHNTEFNAPSPTGN